MIERKIEFKTVSSQGVYEFVGKGFINIQGNKARISFFDEKNNCEIAFSVLSNAKAVLSRKGDLAYTFSLEENRKCFFVIKSQVGDINCELNCNTLKIEILTDKITVFSKYLLSVGGNIENYQVYLNVYKD